MMCKLCGGSGAFILIQRGNAKEQQLYDYAYRCECHKGAETGLPIFNGKYQRKNDKNYAMDVDLNKVNW